MSNPATAAEKTTTQELVPDWLRGVWRRDYIRRASGPGGALGDPDSAVDVRYVQTPWAFVDVRRPDPERAAAAGSKEAAMAFAGVAGVKEGENGGGGAPPLVSWHSCLDMDVSACPDAEDRWAAADAGAPRETEDRGFFRDVSTAEEPDVYIEKDPDGTLEERWVRIDDGGGIFLAARRGTALLVMAGKYFGFATHAIDGAPAKFVAGTSQRASWRIEQSAADVSLEGTGLVLPGKREDWLVLDGSTKQLGDIQPMLKFAG